MAIPGDSPIDIGGCLHAFNNASSESVALTVLLGTSALALSVLGYLAFGTSHATLLGTLPGAIATTALASGPVFSAAALAVLAVQSCKETPPPEPISQDEKLKTD